MNTNKKITGAFIITKPSAFTIVELLVVIVIIAILAIITIVAYNGITTRAANASIQSDLVNASNVLRMYQVDNTKYPDSVTDCPNPSSSSNICLKLSSNNTASYNVNNSSTPQSYNLTITNSTTNNLAVLTNDSKPLTPANTIAPLSPVADWLAIPSSNHYSGYTDHYGNFYDPISKSYATVTRSTPKTIYDPTTQHIYDVPPNTLGIRPRSDGKSGYEAEIEEGRTNYLTNSSFETDSNSDGLADSLSTFKTVNGTPNMTRLMGVHGNYSQNTQYTGVAGDSNNETRVLVHQSSTGFSAGENVTGSVYIKGSVNNCVLDIYLSARDSSYNQLGVSSLTITPSSTSWNRYTVSYSNLPTGTAMIYFNTIHVTSLDAGDSYNLSFDAAQLEKGAFATSYIPTTSAAVTRNADMVTVPTTGWSASTGTFMVVAGDSVHRSSGVGYSLGWNGSNSYINAYDINMSAYFDVYTQGGSDRNNGKALPVGYHTRGSRWNTGTPVRSFVDGSPGTGNLNSIDPSGMSSSAYLGASSFGVNSFGGPIQRLTIYKTALSDTDITTVTSAIKDGPQ